MTIRDISILFGYKIDKNSEAKVNESVERTKSNASKAVKSSAQLGDQTLKQFGRTAKKILAAVGIGVSLKAVYGMMKQYSEDAQAFSAELDSIKKRFGEVIAKTDKELGLMNWLTKSVRNIADKVLPFIEKVGHKLALFTQKIGGIETLLKAVAVVLAAIKMHSKGISLIWLLLFLVVEDVISFIQGKDSILGRFLESAGIDADKVRQKITDTWEKIKTVVGKVWGTIKTSVGAAIQWVSDFWDKHGEQIIETATTIWNTIKGIPQKVSDIVQKIKAFIEPIIQFVRSVIVPIIEWFKGYFDRHGEQLGTAFGNVWEGIKTRVVNVWNKLKATALVIWGAVKAVFDRLKQFWETWGQTIKDFFSGSWEEIKAVFKTALDLITDLFAVFAALFAGDWEQAWEEVKNLFSDLWENICAIFESVWETISTVLSDIWGVVEEKIPEIKEKVIEGFQAAIDWIKGLPSKAVQWGKDFINGLIQGIKEAATKIWGTVTGAFSGIKEFFSRGSSGGSSLDASYYASGSDYTSDAYVAGENGPELIVGQRGKKVYNAFETMNIFRGMARMSDAPTSATTGSVSNTSNRTINQNITFNQQFNGDRAGQQKSAAAMQSAADDVTTRLAHALAYA